MSASKFLLLSELVVVVVKYIDGIHSAIDLVN